MNPSPSQTIFRRIPVLLYHKIGMPPSGVRNPRTWVTPERFTWQMRYLFRRGFRCITPEALAAHYRGEKEADPNAVLITFDDGSRSCFTEALPVMRSFGFTATVFIVSSQLGGRAGWDRNPDHPDDELLTVQQIHELVKSGWSIGAHSVTHRRLTDLQPDEVETEVRSSKQHLEKALGMPIRTFAYPYGAYAVEHLEMVRKAGYEVVFTTHHPERGLSAVRRENIHGQVNRLRFLWRFYRAMRGRFRDDAA